MLNGLSLFSGIGGLDLALMPWVRPVLYCEIDRYAQGVILSQISRGSLPFAPIWDDIRTLKGNDVGSVDIIYGGFPCQDISAAGLGIGLGGERSGLFNHIARLVQETNPRFVFLENVPAIRTRGLNSVIQTFTELGYDCRWTILSAKEIGACHVRKRWFMLAHAKSERCGEKRGLRHKQSSQRPTSSSEAFTNTYGAELWQQSGRSSRPPGEAARISGIDGQARVDSDSNGARLESVGRSESRIPRPVVYHGWVSQPTVCRRDNGIPNKSHRLRALGNSVVPAQAREAFVRLSGIPTPGGEDRG